MSHQTDSDTALLQAIAQGDSAALEQLYARFGGAILSYLTAHTGNRHLAEEVLQDVMLAAWQHAANFRGESKVLTWLLTIARNRAVNAHRKESAHNPPSVPLDDGVNVPSGDTEPSERVERGMTQSAVRKVLTKLPAIYREILTLVFYHQLSGVEIAQVLNLSEGTVKSRLHRAKEAFKRELALEGSL
ncbi:MAG: sigma-70 family RNA polymerase sigma factor [Anaerolineae bacterium]